MLDTLITSKTRIKLLMKFFLNPGMTAHLRGLQEEFHESSNGIRLELNRLEEAGMLVSHVDGQKKVFQVATEHPLYEDINNIVKKYLGLDRLVDQVVEGLGGLEKVYLAGELAEGKFCERVELLFIGQLHTEFLERIVQKAGQLIKKEICYSIFETHEALEASVGTRKNVLLWQG